VTLQRFVGKCVSFLLVIRGAKNFICQANSAFSHSTKCGAKIAMEGSLKEELVFWRFLDDWAGMMLWRDELHQQIVLVSDASLYK